MRRVPFDPATDYYQLLGVRPGASSEEIQTAYRRLAKEYHPDLHAGSNQAAARMARLNVAKSVLLDSATRASYDDSRAARRRGGAVSRAGESSRGRGVPAAGGVPGAEGAPRAADVPPPGAAQPFSGRPRHRVVPRGVGRSHARGTFDRQTGVFLLVAIPLIAALVMYVFDAFQLSIQPLRSAPIDANLPAVPISRPTTRNTAESVFLMVHAQPPDRDLAIRANNFILARTDSAPEHEPLRADGRRLLRAASTDDQEAWTAAVTDLCQRAGHC